MLRPVLRKLDIHSRKAARECRRPGRRLRKYRQTARYYVPKEGLKKGRAQLLRGSYFLKCREERGLIKLLDNNPIPHIFTKDARTIVRKLYYRTLHLLLSRISYGMDRLVVLSLEEYYFNWLNIANWSMGVPWNVNRHSWEKRNWDYWSYRESLSCSGKSSN